MGDIAQKQLTQALKQHQIASNSGNQDKQLYWQSQVSQWAEGGAYKVALHAIAGGLMAQATGSDFKTGALVAGASQALAGALTEKLTPSETNNLNLANQQLNQQLKNQLHQQLATIVGGVTAQLSGEKAQVGMSIAGTADAFNRQLHQREVDAIKAQAEGFQRFAKQRGVILTEAQAEARLIRTMTRVADKQTTIDDGYRQDELAISYLGHNFIDVTPEDYKTSDINWDVVYNNPQTFANAQLYSGSGLTPQEANARNNSAGATVAKVLAASLVAYVVAPYALTAMDSCLLNPVLCVNELGLVAGEVALKGSGLGVTGKSVLKNSGKVPGGSVVTISQGETTLDLLKNAERTKSGLKVDNATLQKIGAAEAGGGKGFSGLTPSIVQNKPATWHGQKTGGTQTVIKYQNEAGQTEFTVHTVTDGAGKVIHRDFDSVLIQSGQQVVK